MAAIILPRKYYRQPQGRVAIDWANPLSQGLRVAFTGSGPNLVNGEMPAGTGGRGADSLGDWFYPTASAHNLRFNLSPEIPTANDFTLFWVNNVQTTSTVRKRALRLSNSSFGTIATLDNGVDDSRLVFSWQTSAGVFAFLDAANHLRFQPARHVIRRSSHPNEIGCRADIPAGRLITLATNQTLRGPMHFLDVGNNLTAFPLQGFIGNVLLWDRYLYIDEVLHLEENIWTVYKADPVRIYSFPTAALPTLSSATAINITSGGFQPRVTATY